MESLNQDQTLREMQNNRGEKYILLLLKLKKPKLCTTVIHLHHDTTGAATQDGDLGYLSLDGEDNKMFTSFLLQAGRPSTISRAEIAREHYCGLT